MKLCRVALVLLFALCIASASQVLAHDGAIQSMDCRITNAVGFPLGKAALKGSQVRLEIGFLQNDLTVNAVEDKAITAMTRGQSWDYIFSFSKPLQAGIEDYAGVLYQQSAMGIRGPLIPVGLLNCKIEI